MHTIPTEDISFQPDEPVYRQIAEHVRRQVALRELKPGARLPTIRSLAQRLNLDPGTVARAYRELESEGIISGRRGSGSFVSSGERHLGEDQQKRLAGLVERAVVEALGMGFSGEDIETAFTMQLARLRQRETPSGIKRGRPGRSQAEIRFVGSHDLSVELLATHFGTLYPELRLSTTFVGSLAGLIALEGREADIAGAHLLDEESGQFNAPFVKRLMPNETVILLHLVRRIQGLMVAPKNPKHILGLQDISRPDIIVVNRQRGSGTRMLLDSRLLSLGIATREIKGYDHEVETHMAVASFIAQGQADVGLGAQSAANAAGLDFIPLLKERYDLVVLKETFESPPLRKLQETVGSDVFRNMLRAIPGYDVSETGKVITVNPKSK